MGRERRVGERGAVENPVYQIPTVDNMFKRTSVSHASALCALQPCLKVNIYINGMKYLYVLLSETKLSLLGKNLCSAIMLRNIKTGS